MPGYLENFPIAWVLGKIPKYPGIWEVSKIFKKYPPQIKGFVVQKASPFF